MIAYQDYTRDSRIANKCGLTIQALEAELAKPEQEYDHPNPAAKHWHDLYKAKCQEFHDKQAMLGTEIVALEEDLAELKEEQLDKPKQEPVAHKVLVECIAGSISQHMTIGLYPKELLSAAEYIVDNYTSPPRKEWVGLTDEDIRGSTDSRHRIFLLGADWAETKLKEKNT